MRSQVVPAQSWTTYNLSGMQASDLGQATEGREMMLESIDHARTVQAILHTAWRSAWCAKAEKVDPESYCIVQSALERVAWDLKSRCLEG